MSASSPSEPAIRTTVVGSYPAPAWLLASPSRATLRDAVMVVLKAQELAGLDVISDGELVRFAPGPPEPQGMIEYFLRPLDGVDARITLADRAGFEAEARVAYRRRPAGVVRAKVGAGGMDLADDLEFVAALTTRPLKFTVTSP